MDRAADLQTPASIGVATTLPPRLKPATWEETPDEFIAHAPNVQLLAAPHGASVKGDRLHFPKAQFSTQEAARLSLASLYPSLAYADANQDGTYNVYNVKVFSVGTWNGDPYDTRDLDDMVTADREIGHQLKPWIKYGHDEQQMYAKSAGLPRAGTVRNLRRDGDVLYGDILNVPPAVYHGMEQKGWEGRSPEIYWDLPFSGNGKTYRRALRALSILGAELPANPTLGDVFHAYADEQASVHIAKGYAEDLMPTAETAMVSAALFAAVLPAAQARFPFARIRGVTLGEQSVTGEWELTLELDERGLTSLRTATVSSSGVHFGPATLAVGKDSIEEARIRAARDGLLISGVGIRITHPAGSVRTGESADGGAWRQVVPFDYGEVVGVTGRDGDNLDVILAPDVQPDAPIFVVSQLHLDGTPDEDKVLLGFADEARARAAYLDFAHDPRMFGGIRVGDAAMLQPALVLAYTFQPSQKRDGSGRWTTLEGFHHAAARELPRGAARSAHLATMHAARAAKAIRAGDDPAPHLAALTARAEALRVNAYRSKDPRDQVVADHYRDLQKRLKGGDVSRVEHHEKPAPPTPRQLLGKAQSVIGAATQPDAADLAGVLNRAALHLGHSYKGEEESHTAEALKAADYVAKNLHLLPSAAREDALSVIHAAHARRDELGMPNPHASVGTPAAGEWQGDTLFGYEKAPTYSSFDHTFDDKENRSVHELTGAANLADLHARMTGQHPDLAHSFTRVKLPHQDRAEVTTLQYSPQGARQMYLKRVYERGPDGLRVTHDQLHLSPSLSKRGVGTFLAQSQEELARAAGARRIDLTANATAGGYVWAQHGYDFVDEGDRQAAKSRVLRQLDRYVSAGALHPDAHAALQAEVAEQRRAHDVATLTIPAKVAPTLTDEQRKVGKRAMLGSLWRGTKDLGQQQPDVTRYRQRKLAVLAPHSADSES